MDRTREFRQTVGALGRTLKAQTRPSPRAAAAPSEFSQRAAAISAGFMDILTSLEELTKAVRNATPDDRSTTEINQRTFHVKQSLGVLSQAIASLAQFQSGTVAAKDHEAGVISQLQGKLTQASREFGKSERALAERRMRYSSGLDQMRSPLLADSPPKPRRPTEESATGSYAMQTLDVESQQEERTSYLQSRHTALQGIESTIHELGAVYQQLAGMIANQGDVVQRIDAHIEDVQINVRRGRVQLERYLRNLTAGQWLMIKIFAILLACIVLYSFLFV